MTTLSSVLVIAVIGIAFLVLVLWATGDLHL
jgi:hypothetical protein